MTPIKNVAILGASGRLGQVLVPALLRAGFTVTSITRQQSSSPQPAGVSVKTADYGDTAGLTAVLQGQHALVETFNPVAAKHQQAIVRACLAAGVSHLITPDFSTDTFSPNADEVMIFETKRRAQRELETLIAESGSALSWTAVIVGAWYDWAIENGAFWIDRQNHTVTRLGSGNQKYSMSRLGLCGDAVVAVLQNPQNFQNRPAYFASNTVSTNQLIAMLKEVTDSEWKITDVPLDGFFDEGRRLWEQDTKNGVTDRLNTRAYSMLGTAAVFDENNRYDADFSGKQEPGWDESEEGLKKTLQGLLL